jgi:hypothetical protein
MSQNQVSYKCNDYSYGFDVRWRRANRNETKMIKRFDQTFQFLRTPLPTHIPLVVNVPTAAADGVEHAFARQLDDERRHLVVALIVPIDLRCVGVRKGIGFMASINQYNINTRRVRLASRRWRNMICTQD